MQGFGELCELFGDHHVGRSSGAGDFHQAADRRALRRHGRHQGPLRMAGDDHAADFALAG